MIQKPQQPRGIPALLAWNPSWGWGRAGLHIWVIFGSLSHFWVTLNHFWVILRHFLGYRSFKVPSKPNHSMIPEGSEQSGWGSVHPPPWMIKPNCLLHLFSQQRSLWYLLDKNHIFLLFLSIPQWILSFLSKYWWEVGGGWKLSSPWHEFFASWAERFRGGNISHQSWAQHSQNGEKKNKKNWKIWMCFLHSGIQNSMGKSLGLTLSICLG